LNSFVNENYNFENKDLEKEIIEILKPESEMVDGKEVLVLYNDNGMGINFELFYDR
jgi:hypothetical protein